MRKYFLLVFVINSLFAQESFTLFYPSVYYTYGNYSNNIKTRAFSFYSSVNHNSDYMFGLAAENLNLSQQDYSYNQQSLILSNTIPYFPFYFKYAVGGQKGKTNLPLFPEINSSYKSLLFSLENLFYFDYSYLGMGCNYFNSNDSLKSLTFFIRGETFLSYSFYVSVKPTFYTNNENEKLFSISLKGLYWFNKDLMLKGEVVIGKRKFYFDNDLLTFFNQNEIQKGVYSLLAEYAVIPNLTIAASYIHTKFDGYSINYIVGGVRGNFWF